MGAPSMTAHASVAASAASLTHLQVRSVGCSAAPWPDLALAGATGT